MEAYKHDFLEHFVALGLDEKLNKRNEGLLLANMGRKAVKIYDRSYGLHKQKATEITSSRHNLERTNMIYRQYSVSSIVTKGYITIGTLNVKNS